jgi:succinate-acetate transporter protein
LALQAIFLALWIIFLLLTAALAFYLAAAEVINETHGHAVLPVGAPQVAEPPLGAQLA